MKRAVTYLLALAAGLSAYHCKAQTSCEVPLPPVLTSVSINSITGFTELQWTPSPSAGIAAYIVYNHTSGFGIPVDTIWDPASTSYSFYSSAIKYFSESYVVAAFRKPICTSPLSNILSTIFCSATLDTCQNKIELKWNKYADYPSRVSGYEISIINNGGLPVQTVITGSGSNSLIISEFETDLQYCFTVNAKLENGSLPGSNSTCLITKMQRVPRWINADYATITDNENISLSFTIDPASELRTFILERKKGSSGTFEKINQFSNVTSAVNYTDESADLNTINTYRLGVMNNCNTPIAYSNLASNIILDLEQGPSEIRLTWNKYRTWNGNTDKYEVYAKTGTYAEKISTLSSTDTTVTIPYSTLMYKATGGEVCFYVKAYESGNSYGISGTSQSITKCIPQTEVITIPNTFTPDNDLINDHFKPVLSFTPSSYRLVITDMKRKVVFESGDHLDEWDGTFNGVQQPDGVYLWQLKLVPPSGETIVKTGTITIIRIR